MNHEHLRTLMAIVDEGSFEGAAEALGITPSAVSQRVKALETDVGRVVVERVTPPVGSPWASRSMPTPWPPGSVRSSPRSPLGTMWCSD